MGTIASQGHAGAGSARHQALLLVDNVAVDYPDGFPAMNNTGVSFKRRDPYRAQEIYFQLERRETLAVDERTGVSRAHGGVCDVAKHAAVKRTHRIGEFFVGVELDGGLSGSVIRDRETEQVADRRRKTLA